MLPSEYGQPSGDRAHAHMLDTNVFNDVLDGGISLVSFANRHVLVTGIQASELRATSDIGRRTILLDMIGQIDPAQISASSLAFDIEGAGFDQAFWNDGSGNFEKMLIRLRELDKNNKRRKYHLNQMRDILIAETAIKNGATLVSADRNLRKVVSEFGGKSITLAEFCVP